MEAECIFCRIVAGDAPAFVFADDDRTVAFLDRGATEGHTLVVPRSHAADVWAIANAATRASWRAPNGFARPQGRGIFRELRAIIDLFGQTGLAESSDVGPGGKRLRYFLDTEHTDDGVRFELISIAVVCEDGREYYAAVDGYDSAAVTPWIAEHVVPNLPPPGDPLWKSRGQIRDDLAAFVTGDDIEFWTMCAWSDWSLVVRLFGRFEDIPDAWPMACWDLWQLEAESGVTQAERLPEPEGVHNALIDARYHRRILEALRRSQATRSADQQQS